MSDRSVIHLDDLFYSESHAMQFLSDVQGRCVVANGCFDVLHLGHLHLLSTLDTVAYQMKLRPIVAMNSDESVRLIKGDYRPVVPHTSRAQLVTCLKWPLSVVLFDEKTPQRLMDLLRPLVVVKGSEYSKESVIRWEGSQVVTVDMVSGWSTSRMLGYARTAGGFG